MYQNTFQKGFLSVFCSIGSQPLMIWDSKVQNGYIKRISDDDVKSLVMEIRGVNVATCFISTPASPCPKLGIKLPFLTIIVKNMHKSFTFEIQVLDDQNQNRRFRFSNYQSKSRVTNFATSMPLALNDGWNQIQLNLADFTRRAYGTNYMETSKIIIHANCRLRNIYFSDRLYADDEKPATFKIHDPKPKQKPLKVKQPIVEDVQENPETVRPSSPVDVEEPKQSMVEEREDEYENAEIVQTSSPPELIAEEYENIEIVPTSSLAELKVESSIIEQPVKDSEENVEIVDTSPAPVEELKTESLIIGQPVKDQQETVSGSPNIEHSKRKVSFEDHVDENLIEKVDQAPPVEETL